MGNIQRFTILCLASYEKGHDFIRECKQQGWRVLLLTQTALKDAAWPREAIDDLFMLPDMYNRQELVAGVSYLARTECIDKIAALDDFDVELAAALREHLRVPGMGESTARFFRDKLAMRMRAAELGIPVPPFNHALNQNALQAFMEHVPPPWVLKPRSEASSVGIQKLNQPAALWTALESLADRQSFYLLEQFIAGPVYHVDSLVADGAVVFAETHRYATPLLEVSQGGGIFCSRTLRRGSDDEQTLLQHNRDVLRGLGLEQGAAHTEFIKGEDGHFYFLETAARVGGANIAELVAAATDVNLWREWAKLEVGLQPYSPPPPRQDYAGIVICLARQEHPDMSAYQDPEIVVRINKQHHAGLIVASSNPDRIDALLDDYLQRFASDFYAYHPAPDKPTS